jgi:predicted DNA-binding protein
MRVMTCKLSSALNGRLADLAKRHGVPKSVIVREAIEAKIAEDIAAPRKRAADLIEALGDSIGSIASGKGDLARNKKRLRGYGR